MTVCVCVSVLSILISLDCFVSSVSDGTDYDDTFVTSEPVTVSYNDTEGHSTSRGTPRSCPDLEHVPYASYAIRNHSRLVTYTCNFGYELHGSAQRECLANGSWSGESPTCLRK